MLGTATAPRPSPARIGAQLRTDQHSSRLSAAGRFGNNSTRGLSTMPSSMVAERADVSSFRSNPEAQFSAKRTAMRKFQYPGNAMPKLQEMSSALRESDTDQESDANEIDQQAAQIADESDTAESMSLAARARSRAKSATSDGMQKMMDMAKKEMEEIMAEVKAELTSKAGPLDEGELLLLGNTTLTSMSIVRSFMGIFSASLKKYSPILNKIGMPIPNKLKIIGGAGTAFQFFLWTGLLTILTCMLIFIVYSIAVMHKIQVNPFGAEGRMLLKALLP